MANETNTLPRFTRSADAGIDEIRGIYAERGEQYGDTLEHCEFLTLRAACAEFVGFNLTKDQARILAQAALVDTKHERFRGGWKRDNLVDKLAYGSVLLGETGPLEKGGAK